METFEKVVTIITPIVMGLMVIVKLWLELKKTEAQRTAVIKGVKKHLDKHPTTGPVLKEHIASEARKAGVEKSLRKAVRDAVG